MFVPPLPLIFPDRTVKLCMSHYPYTALSARSQLFSLLAVASIEALFSTRQPHGLFSLRFSILHCIKTHFARHFALLTATRNSQQLLLYSLFQSFLLLQLQCVCFSESKAQETTKQVLSTFEHFNVLFFAKKDHLTFYFKFGTFFM